MQSTFETKAAELVGIAEKNDCQTEVCILFIHIQTCIQETFPCRKKTDDERRSGLDSKLKEKINPRHELYGEAQWQKVIKKCFFQCEKQLWRENGNWSGAD